MFGVGFLGFGICLGRIFDDCWNIVFVIFKHIFKGFFLGGVMFGMCLEDFPEDF